MFVGMLTSDNLWAFCSVFGELCVELLGKWVSAKHWHVTGFVPPTQSRPRQLCGV